MKTKNGKIVTKRQHEARKKLFKGSKLEKWINAVKEARKELGITGFVIIGGSSPTGKALYAKAKSFYSGA